MAGGFLTYLSGESIHIRDLPPSAGPRASSRVTIDVSGQGASVGWSARF